MEILKSFTVFFLCALTFVLSGCGGDPQGVQETTPQINTNGGELPLVKVTLGQEVTGNQGGYDTAGIVITSSNKVVTVTIKTHTQGQIFGYQLYVAYKPADLEYIGCQRGGFLGGDTVFPVSVMGSNKGAADLVFNGWQKSTYQKAVLISESRSGWNAPGFMGDGDILVLYFNAVSGNTTELLFAESLLFEKIYTDEIPSPKSMDIPRYVQFTPL